MEILSACSYDDAVELVGHGRYNYLVLVACSLITNAAALDMFGFSIVVAASRCDLNLGFTETGALASVPFVGVFFAFVWGYYADTRGRRRALLWSTGVGFVFAALTSFAPSWHYMLVCKLVGCCFSVASFTLTMTYLGECTGSKRRSRYLFIMNSMNLASEFASFSLALLVLPLELDLPIPLLGITYKSWRLFTLVLALPLGVGAVFMLFLYESPKFLANKGLEEEALFVLKRIYECNGGKKGEYPVIHLEKQTDTAELKPYFWNTMVSQTASLFRPPFLWKTLILFYLMGVCCSTNNVYFMWYPVIVNMFFNHQPEGGNHEMGFCDRMFMNASSDYIDNQGCTDTISTSTIYSGILYGLFFCVLTLAVTPFASRRRLVLLTFLMTSVVSGILVDLIKEPISNMILFTLMQSTVIGIGSVASYFVDLYPTSNRGLVTSLGMMVGRWFSLAGVNLIGAIIRDYCRATFMGWSVFVLSGVLVTLFLPRDKITSV